MKGLLLLAFGLLFAAFPAVAEQAVPVSFEKVRQMADAWLDGMSGKVYQATLQSADKILPLPSKKVSDSLYALESGNVYIGLGFKEALPADITPDALKNRFDHLALTRLPLPGVEIEGWEIRLQTPASKFSDGVTFEKLENGVLTIRVQTEFFAVYGQRTDIVVPADAPMPAGTFFEIRKPVKADLLIEGAFPPAP